MKDIIIHLNLHPWTLHNNNGLSVAIQVVLKQVLPFVDYKDMVN